MANWTYNANEVEDLDFLPIPIGDHRVRIAKAEEKKAKSGNDMLVVTLDVSGHNGSLWHYIVFMPDNTVMTNTKLSQFWNCFGIPEGNMNIATWAGKIGAIRVKHEQYNGETQAKIAYLIKKDKQDGLPAWVEPSNKASYTGQANIGVEVSDDDLPF
ncbi:MAG: DUF669 domain-containing protein [Oscillospiraceae bacterium]